MNWLPEKNDSCSGPDCEFRDNLNIIREIYLFSKIPISTLKVFAYLCTREKFKTGEYIFTQEENDGQAFYFISGEASLIRTDNDQEVTVREYRKGDFCGALTLIGNFSRLFSMKAMTPVICLVLSREKFTQAMIQYPELMMNIVKTVFEKIHVWEKNFLTTEGGSACLKKAGVSNI